MDTLDVVDKHNYLESVVTSDKRCIRKIKCKLHQTRCTF